MVGTRSAKVRPNKALGEALVKARRNRNMKVSDAAAALGMPERHLRSLEEGDFSVFAAEVYGRGAYLRYAVFLGMDSKKAERSVSKALLEARERVPLRIHTPLTWFQRMLTPKTTLVVSLSVVGLLVGGYIVWQVQSFWRLPDLTVDEPLDASVESTSVTVRGRTEQNARLIVNGEPVLLGEKGSFEYDLHLHPGINIVRVEAENAAGRVNVVERHVLLMTQDG